MAYGTLKSDVVQSSTAGTPPQFNDGNGTQTGTLCRAWVNFNGSTAAVRASFNVTSVTKNGTGDYTVNFTNAFADINYSGVGSGGNAAGGGYDIYMPWQQAPTTTTMRVATWFGNSSAATDCLYTQLSFFR